MFGGQYVSSSLKNRLDEISEAFKKYSADEEFLKELSSYLCDYVGRPSPLYFARDLSKRYGARIYLKREDLNHTGSHKINNALGQALLAKKMGKKHIVCETGAGQHGVATASVCSLFDLKCTVFMGEEDIKRQMPNVKRMRLLGAEINSVKSGGATLKDAVDEAFKYLEEHDDAYYLIGSAVGPKPYPEMVEFFQKIIGEEIRKQIYLKEDRLPDMMVACVGGGSNAIGMFSDFIKEEDVKLYGVESAGSGIDTGKHASALAEGKIAIEHGMKSYFLLDENGKTRNAYTLSAGLDYPGVGPRHAQLHDSGRVTYVSIKDEEAIEAFKLLTNVEGIIPALESSYALAYGLKLCKESRPNSIIVINLSGRGDKDLDLI